MRELIRTNDTVLLCYVEALLKDAGIGAAVVDRNMSAIEGSLGILPRRVLVGTTIGPRRARAGRRRAWPLGRRERRGGMSAPDTELRAGDATDDAFLGGALRVLQPLSGYRAGVDAVLLAAAAPLDAGRAARVLDCGAGVGTVGLSLPSASPMQRSCSSSVSRASSRWRGRTSPAMILPAASVL